MDQNGNFYGKTLTLEDTKFKVHGEEAMEERFVIRMPRGNPWDDRDTLDSQSKDSQDGIDTQVCVEKRRQLLHIGPIPPIRPIAALNSTGEFDCLNLLLIAWYGKYC